MLKENIKMINETNPAQPGNDSASQFFLPDLCSVQALLFLIIGTETGALIFTVIHSGLQRFNWDYFALCSFFMLWIVLVSTVLLCQIRRMKLTLSLPRQGRLAYFIVILVTVLFAFLTDFIFRQPNTAQRDYWFIIETVLISTVLTGIILRYFYLHHLWHLQQRSELESRVMALQARIRPHFLFNSMNSIAGLIHEDSEAAEEAVLDLAELFRATLKDPSRLVPVNDELALCKRYLSIEKLRLGKRLSIDWQLSNLTSTAKVPPLSIQPLVENAICHGIQPIPQGGRLLIDAHEQDDWLYVMVSNPIPPVSKENLHQGNRIAMQNIKSRLQAVFGDKAILKSSQLNNIYTATLRIPLQRKGAH